MCDKIAHVLVDGEVAHRCNLGQMKSLHFRGAAKKFRALMLAGARAAFLLRRPVSGPLSPVGVGLCFFSQKKSRKKVDMKPLPEVHVKDSWAQTRARVFQDDYQNMNNFLCRVDKMWLLNESGLLQEEVVESCRNNSHPSYRVGNVKTLTVPPALKRYLRSNVDVLKVCGIGRTRTDARQQANSLLACELYEQLLLADSLLPARDVSLTTDVPEFEVNMTADQMTSLAVASESLSRHVAMLPELDLDRHRMRAFRDSAKGRPQQHPLPDFNFKKLPILTEYDRIVQSIANHQVTILSAFTGSGKTTQVPQYILKAFWDQNPLIMVTQPRRIAAISLARRVAEELGEGDVGRSVGYAVRFDSVKPEAGRSSVLFCTSGLVLRMLAQGDDARFNQCTHLILDEIHERDLSTDTLLLLCRRLMKHRNLKLVIMSATVDAAKFRAYFGASEIDTGEPILVDGRSNFPVQSFGLESVATMVQRERLGIGARRYLEDELAGQSAGREVEAVPGDLIAHLVKHLHAKKPPGSILCFLPGWEEIVAVRDCLESGQLKHELAIHLIHSTSPPGAADAIFKSAQGGRKIILATNVAESSITIPDVSYIIDSGRQKVNRYNPSTRMNTLEMSWISASNWIQRRGRIGRTGPGEYYMMWSSKRQLAPTLAPEMLRVGLEEVCLELKALGIVEPVGRVLAQAVDPPNRFSVKSAIESLVSLGAVQAEDEALTPIGRALARLPLAPRFGRFLLVSTLLGCRREAMHIVSALSGRIFRALRTEDQKARLRSVYGSLYPERANDFEAIVKVLDLFERGVLFQTLSRDQLDVLSISSIQSCLRVSRALEQQLRLPELVSVEPGLRNDMLRLLLVGAMYPDVALKCPKRNLYMLPSGQTADLSKESVLIEESAEALMAPGTAPEEIRAAPSLVAFEELFDGGHRRLVRVTSASVVHLLLFAERLQLQPGAVLVDGWIRVRAENSVLQLLVKARSLWIDHLQYLLTCAVSGQAIDPDHASSFSSFVSAFLATSAGKPPFAWARK